MSLLRALVATVILSLALTACSAARNDPGEPAGATPDWTHIDVPRSALPTAPVRSAAAAIGRDRRVPLTVVGTLTRPGEQSQAVYWQAAGAGLGREHRFQVPGTATMAHRIDTVGRTTFVTGWTWSGGGLRSWVQRSQDRARWRPVALPDELASRDLYVGAVFGTARRPLAAVTSLGEAAILDLRSGAITDLPDLGDGLTPYDVAGATRFGRVAVVLVQARDADGTDLVVPVVSAGEGWEPASPLASTDTEVTGVAVADGEVIATGSQLIGDSSRAIAWTSSDGAGWVADSVEYAETDRWSTTLGAPTVDRTGVYAAVADDVTTHTTVMRRQADGTWRPWGPPVAVWEEPGTSALVARDGASTLVVRSEGGAFQAVRMTLRPAGMEIVLDDTQPATSSVSWWSGIYGDDETITLVGAHQEVTVQETADGGDSWERRTHLTPFTLRGTELGDGAWDPRRARELGDIEVASAPDGTRLLVGEHLIRHDDGSLDVRLRGWIQRAGGRWRAIEGLPASGTTYLYSVSYLDGAWAITGSTQPDAANSVANGRAWTSSDGQHWYAQTGPFSSTRDTWLNDTCRLPDGDLLAVGGSADPRSGSRPLALRKNGSRWRDVRLGRLGEEVVGLGACIGVSDAVIVEGWDTGQRLWRTEDGRNFTPITLGDPGDALTDLIAVPHGIAGPGYRTSGGLEQPVVWLSTDGTEWTSIDIPTAGPSGISTARLIGDRLVLALTADGGPEVLVLENVAELLADGPQS